MWCLSLQAWQARDEDVDFKRYGGLEKRDVRFSRVAEFDGAKAG